MTISIYRGAGVNINVNVLESSGITRKLNGEDICKLQIESTAVLDLAIGDYFTVFSRNYYLNLLPEVTKSGSRLYKYDCIFESRQYELGKIVFMDSVQGAEFSYTGDLDFFLTQLVANVNRGQSGWSKGSVEATTATKTLQFSNENCLAVLQRLCDEYALTFSISEAKAISVITTAQGTPLSFSYGKGKGLYTLNRKLIDSANIITRVYPFGSQRNIAANYRSGSGRLKLSTSYLDQNTGLYGVIEGVKVWDEIYPRFNGSITSAPSPLVFVDTSIDFDLNLYVVPGGTPKVHFNSGLLSGYEFEISYVHATHTVTLRETQQEKVTDTNGTMTPLVLPNSTLKPAALDKYVFLDIVMPETPTLHYVTAAETELYNKAVAFLAENSSPRVSYQLEIDPKYMSDNSYTLNMGEYVTVVDTELGINRAVRIIGLTRNLWYPDKYTVEIGDQLEVNLYTRMISDVSEIKRLVIINKLDDVARAKRSWRNQEEVLNYIFDPDGTFDGSRLKPESVTTNMLAVGNKSQQLIINGIVLEPNYDGDNTKVYGSAGTLVHLTIDVNPKTWNIASCNYTGRAYGTPYYIYAKCERSGTNGTIVIDTVQRKVDSDGTYYYFMIGMLHSASTSTEARAISLTYGSTTINGRFIKTGKIQSSDGSSYIDLDNNTIVMSGNSIQDVKDDADTALVAAMSKKIYSDLFNWPISEFASKWANYSGSGATVMVVDPLALGGQILRLGDNAGNDQVWMIGKKSALFDPNRLYRVRARVRRTLGTGTIYIGIAGRDITDTLFVNASGTDAYNLQYYHAAQALNPADTNWIIRTGYFKGRADVPDYALSTNPLDPGSLHTNVGYIRPLILGNYSTQAGTFEIDYIEIDYAEEDAAQATAALAEVNAQTGITNAGLAQGLLDDMANDNMITALEKQTARSEWNVIAAELTLNNTQADTFGITTEKATYGSAFQSLATYLNNGTTWSSGIPSWIADANLGVTTAIVGATFRANWRAYYDARTVLLNAVAAKARTLANNAQGTADSKAKTFVQTSIPTSISIGDIWYDSDDKNKMYRAAAAGATTIAAGAWVTVRDTDIAQSIADALAAHNLADTAETNAQTAITNAATANGLLDDMADDTKITPNEKLTLKPIWDAIVTEGAPTTGTIPVQATLFGVADTAFDTAYSTLNAYLNVALWVFDDMAATTNINRTTWDTNWNSYYNARTVLLNAIATEAKTRADNIRNGITQSGGGNHCKNGDFEHGTNPWSKYNNGANAGVAFSIETTGGLYGTSCAKVFVPAGGATGTLGITGAACKRTVWVVGQPYVISFWAKAVNSIAGKNMGLAWNSGPQSTVALVNPALTTSWQRYEFRIKWTATPIEPSGSIWLTVSPMPVVSFGDIYFDGVSVTEGDIPVPFAPSPWDAYDAADAALADLTKIAADTVLSKGEKPYVVREYNTLIAEQAGIDAKATLWNITTEKTTYDAAVTALTNYLTGLTSWNVVTVDTTIVAATFETKWKDVYTTRQALLNKIYDLASYKKRHFIVTPTTPYAVGDTWSNGSVLYVCTNALASGAFYVGDWAFATTYDNTQDVIDAGITSGLLSGFALGEDKLSFGDGGRYLGLSNQEIISAGGHGRGLSIINHDSVAGATGVSFCSLGQIRPLDSAYFGATPQYGFEVLKKIAATTYKHVIRMAGDANLIAGWNIDFDAIYIGTKKTSDGFAAAGSLSIASNGSIHAENFYINSDGSIAVKNIKIQTSSDGTGNVHTIDELGLYESAYNNDYATTFINLVGYQGGTTKFRVLDIGNGKGVNMARFSGLSNTFILYAGMYSYEGIVFSKGLAAISNDVMTNSTYLTKDDYHVTFGYSGGAGTLYLPTTPIAGQQIIINNIGGYTLTIQGNGKSIYDNGAGAANSIPIANRRSISFIYNGAWQTTSYR